VATKLGALTELFSPGLELMLPDRDGTQREYVIPLASAELGLWCRAIAEARNRDDIDEDDLPELPGKASFEQRVLGTAYDQMLKAGTPDEYIKFAGATAFIWITLGEEQAKVFWEAGGDPKAVKTGNREERRAAKRAGATSTAAAAETRPQASTSGTRSQKKSGRRRRDR
jgi:hypothetical protein